MLANPELIKVSSKYSRPDHQRQPVEISLREGVHPQFLRSVEFDGNPTYTQEQENHTHERKALMHTNLPVYRKATALMLLILVFCYVLFYGKDTQQE